MFYRRDWERVRARHARFFSDDVPETCLISVYAPTCARYGVAPSRSPEERVARRTDPELILKDALTAFEHTCFEGDAFATLSLDFGASGHAGFFRGAKYQMGDTVWFFPSMEESGGALPEFDETMPLYRQTMEAARYLTRESGGRYLLSTPDIAGNADALSHLRGAENLMLDMYDEPEWVEQAIERIRAGWSRAMDAFYDISLKCNDGGSGIGWLHTFAPGRHAQLQCDMSVMLSSELFDRFIAPDLSAQSAALDAPMYHLDGMEQLRHLDTILALPNLKAIQWTRVAGQPSPVNFIPALKRIQQSGVRLLINHIGVNEMLSLIEALDPGLIHFVIDAPDAQSARHAVQAAESACARKRPTFAGFRPEDGAMEARK